MFISCPQILSPLKNSLKTYVAMLFFMVAIVYFRIRIRERWFDVLENRWVLLPWHAGPIKHSQDKVSSVFCFWLFSSNKEKVWLHHRRLGHQLLELLKVCFSSLFRSLDVEQFNFKVFKHNIVPFLSSNERSFIYFYLIYSNIQWLSTTPNATPQNLDCDLECN